MSDVNPGHQVKFDLNAEEDKAVHEAMHNVLLVQVRGVVAVCPHMPPLKIMALLCHTLARVMCELYVADMISVHKFRKTCRDVFDVTMKEMPVIEPKKAADEAMTAVG